jgi:dienelactone hydrolase
MKFIWKLLLAFGLLNAAVSAQTDEATIAPILEKQIQSQDVTADELRRFLIRKIAQLPTPRTAEQWTAQAKQIRARLLSEVVFNGWPREWVEAKLKFEDLGLAGSGAGYRIRKLRYEIVPGFQSTALLYEPEVMRGKIPAILNVNGHVGPEGKAVEYKQKRCINQARQGILSLSLEWIGEGELSNHGNEHWFGAHLDLAGANAVGLFYLAMRRGLDYLYQLPGVDPARIGMTGLSGGGWQTIVLSALDERIQVAVPVAGFGPFLPRLERMKDVGDIEQNATDMFSSIDYTHLAAMRAPRPTLLIYNAEDDCCFRAPIMKPLVFNAIRPFFRMYGREEQLGWHENLDPANHNYQLDNRLQSYSFFAKYFGLPAVETETPAGGELETAEQLSVGVPQDNLTILKLAKIMAQRSRQETPRPESQPADLRRVVRYEAVRVTHPWMVTNTKRKGLETISYRFEFGNGLSASGVWLKAIGAPVASTATILLDDSGRKAEARQVAGRVNRGEEVLAADLLFTGDMSTPNKPGNTAYTQCLSTTGERPLGIEAAQLIALAEWIKSSLQVKIVRVESIGMRSQMAATVAAALMPKLFSEVEIARGIPSLQRLLDAPVEYPQAPDLFCFDLLRRFDVPVLEKMSAPTKIICKNCQARGGS